MGRLSGAVNDEIEAVRAEQSLHGNAVTDVQIVMSEVPGDPAQTVQIPGCVARIPEKDAAHIVVDAVDFAALTVKVLNGFRANQPAGSGNQNCLQGHDRDSIFLTEVRNA
jgi:hypothetical protein